MKKIMVMLMMVLLVLFCGFFSVVRMTPAVLLCPAPDQFGGIVSEAGLMQWTMEDSGRELDVSAETAYFSRAWLYELVGRDRRVRCQVLSYLSRAGTPGLTISFQPVDAVPLTVEENQQFFSEKLPELWILASKLCSDPQVVLDLQGQMESAYDRVTAPEQYTDRIAYFGEWGAQRSGIYATARMVKQDSDSPPMWYQIKLVSRAEYYDSSVLGEWTLSEAQVLSQAISGNSTRQEKQEDLGKKYFLEGTLTQIAIADDFRIRSGLSLNLPANMFFYQKAVLTDESGSLPVYIAPTALSQKELSHKRLHLVQNVQNKNHETCYVITRSCLIK